MRIDESAGDPGPRFCPHCGSVAEVTAQEVLCRNCGDRLLPQGYCGTCEAHWPMPPGTPCPKHELTLEEWTSAVVDRLPAADAGKWVIVATFADALQAQAPRIRLEAEGIPTFLEGARMGSQSMYHVATGGVKLHVPEPLVDDARVLLSQSWTPPMVDDDLDDAWDELAPEPGSVRRAVMKGVIVFLLVAPALVALLGFCFGPR